MMGQGRAPRMKDAGHANLRAKPFGIVGDGRHCFCRGLKQQTIDGLLVPIGDAGNLRRKSENNVEVFYGKQINAYINRGTPLAH